MKLAVHTIEKQSVGEVETPEQWDDLQVNGGLIFSAYHAERTNRRQGTASTKTRSNVRGSNIKPYRQKGTGRARHGSKQSPLFVGGGVTFGPLPRDFDDRLPRKQRKQALLHALVQKIRDEKLQLVNEWHCDDAKTKTVVAQLKVLGLSEVLVVLDAPNVSLTRSIRNIPHCATRNAQCFNATDCVVNDHIVMTQAAFEQIKERIAS
jgi:large subunit ribosomal protein L4